MYDSWVRSLDAVPGSEVSDREQREIARDLEYMLADFWFDVDTNYGRNASGFYTNDGVFQASKEIYRGREMIAAFYKYREDQGPRVAAHVYSNFRVRIESPTSAVTTWYLTLYAHDGVPVLTAAPPIQIGLSTDFCVKEADGRWRYKKRKFDVWFKGGVPTPQPRFESKSGS